MYNSLILHRTALKNWSLYSTKYLGTVLYSFVYLVTLQNWTVQHMSLGTVLYTIIYLVTLQNWTVLQYVPRHCTVFLYVRVPRHFIELNCTAICTWSLYRTELYCSMYLDTVFIPLFTWSLYRTELYCKMYLGTVLYSIMYLVTLQNWTVLYYVPGHCTLFLYVPGHFTELNCTAICT